MDSPKIYTQRFSLTKMTAADGEKYHRLSDNDKVMRFVTGYSLSREESDEMLKGFLAEYAQDSPFGRYLIEGRYDGKLIGSAKLDKAGNEVEIGYRVIEEEWGKGIATEVAAGLISYSLNTLKASNVIAYVNVDNGASVRVLEKAGMTNVETIEDLDETRYKFSYSPQTAPPMKKVLYVVLGLIALVFIAAFILPKNYSVRKEILINKPEAEVFAFLKPLKNQDKWSKWARLDPNMKKTYEGVDGTVGFIARWEGNDDVGTGEQEITKISEGDRIETELRFLKPIKSTSKAHMATEFIDERTTRVTWGFKGNMPIPMNVLLPILRFDESIGRDLEEGLNNLKDILEKQ